MRAKVIGIVLLLLAIPVIDGAFVIWLANALGTGTTIVLIAAATCLGFVWDAICWAKLRRAAQTKHGRGAQATHTFASEALVLQIAMILFLMPGFVTDALGFVLLLPPIFGRITGHLTEVFARTEKEAREGKRRKARKLSTRFIN